MNRHPIHRHTLASRMIVLLLCPALASAGCATTVPYTGQGPHPQIERGVPVLPIDVLGNVFGLISKLFLWNWNVDVHDISPETEQAVVAYLQQRDLPLLHETKFRLNQYKPHQDLSRLVKNRHVAWPYRLLLGLPVTLLFEVLLPGRLLGGDHYNPYTNTVHIYSDLSSVALHEAGHAHDFANQRYKGTYALARWIPFVDLYQEFQATDEAIEYLVANNYRDTEFEAYKVLYPAYGSYVGNYIFFPFGVIAIVVGHIYGRWTVHERQEFYRQLDASMTGTVPDSGPVPAPAAP